jgi:hypothetical protein
MKIDEMFGPTMAQKVSYWLITRTLALLVVGGIVGTIATIVHFIIKFW